MDKKMPEVEKALKELKEEIKEIDKIHFKQFYSDHKDNQTLSYPIRLYTLLNRKAQNLVNALEAQPKAIKPPLGLIPKWLRDDQRKEEIEAAISRYNKVKKEIPKEWLEEFEVLQSDKKQVEAEKEIEEDALLYGHGFSRVTVDEEGRERLKLIPWSEIYKMPEDKPKSLWKDVSEAPEESCSVILKDERGHYQRGDYLSGHFFTDGKKFNAVQYATDTCFINQTEKLSKKVEEMERKQKRLWSWARKQIGATDEF